MQNIDITIIVCAYNGESTIFPCIKSLLDQSKIKPNKYEIIVVDDGSEDNTKNITKNILSESKNTDPLFSYILIEHSGLSIARNVGLFYAKAPIVAYIDQDAIAHTNWIFELLSSWKNNFTADVIGGNVKTRNKTSAVAVFLNAVYYSQMLSNGIIGTNMSFKKNRLINIGAFGDVLRPTC